ncbi:hypothetical protein CspeluHIS016_0500870 [Cutaneotrichosporon spelunceum]|uniref:F-box domain-containing protein n=1 Tax=Cutaneotrichosporon spelunceum TaxID=1672016 RepID=A0AAD3YCF5_9TREE|nr:hypothetical protein CspeluHIS016_0500870 [Cutaneotrichosporon spelunceum]
MIDSGAYPHIVDSIFEQAPSSALLALRAVCRAWRDTADRRLVRHIALVKGYKALSKMDGEHLRLPFDLATRRDLQRAVNCLDVEREVEEWDLRPPCAILPFLAPAVIRNYGGITPFNVGDFPRGRTLVQLEHDRFTHFGSGPSRWALHLCHSVERVVVDYSKPPYAHKNRELLYCLTALSTEVREVVLLLDTEAGATDELRQTLATILGDRIKEPLRRIESRPPPFVLVASSDFPAWLAGQAAGETTFEDAVVRLARGERCRWSDDELRAIAHTAVSFETHDAYRARVGAEAYDLEWQGARQV